MLEALLWGGGGGVGEGLFSPNKPTRGLWLV